MIYNHGVMIPIQVVYRYFILRLVLYLAINLIPDIFILRGAQMHRERSVSAAIHSLLVGNSTPKDQKSADSWLTNTDRNASFFYGSIMHRFIYGSICFSQYRSLPEELLRILAYTRTVILFQSLIGIRAEALSE